MKIDYENVIFPWPVLSKGSNDFIDNVFELNIYDTNFIEGKKIIEFGIELICTNEDILNNINYIESIVHIENRAQRNILSLELNRKKIIKLNLDDFCTNDSVEVIGLLVCKNDLEIKSFQSLDISFRNSKLNYSYKVGDLIGFTSSKRIDFIENYGFKDILRISKSKVVEVFEIDLNDNVISLYINEELFNLLEQYNLENTDSALAKIVFIYPAIMSAIADMKNDDEGVYSQYNWYKAIKSKLESKKVQITSDIDTKEVVRLTHLILENMVLEVLRMNMKVQ